MYYNEDLIFSSNGESNYRIPSLIVTNDGTVLAFCNNRKSTLKDHATDTVLVYARKEPGKGWSLPTTLMEHEGVCCLIGSAVHDSEANTSFVFVRRKFARDEFGAFTEDQLERLQEEDNRRAEQLGIELGDFQFSSTDSGKSWAMKKVVQKPLVFTSAEGKEVIAPMFTHGGAHGIQLRHGMYRGRLLCPSRMSTGRYTNWEDIRKCVYNNAAYSDDHGKSWQVSKPVQLGTGEGALIELGNGDILYNSRAYFADQKRYLAKSTNGGESYTDFGTDNFLLEPERTGCNASFLRVDRSDLGEELAKKYLPDSADAITLFVNPRAKARRCMTACVSFDDGEHWTVAKSFYNSPCAYSSLDFSRADKHFYLIYEKGTDNPYSMGISAVEFDLEWLLSQEI